MRWIVGVLGAAAVAGGVALWLGSGAQRSGTAVIGDAAPAILAATGWQQALPVGAAALTVVSVEGWDRLRYIEDMARLCSARCAGEAALVRIAALRPGGSRKIVLVDLSRWEGETGMACLAQVLDAERRTVTAPALPDCAADRRMGRTRWSLPFDLGTV